ncbi:MAG TPA: alanine--tRNA ligase [Bacteroidia bacterium]|nr:alanine--tRNA ligase [Bacteroidia bacterium]
MNSTQIRSTFLEFFKSKGHEIVPSAPMVVKNDPTLMFTNSGMAPFKDLFLGNAPIKFPRIADTQKCLRVSGKHNDLEEVGVDTYHHTMFEMLGNWSFGDYFKKEAIAWAWELLHDVYKIDADRMYVTVFEGNADEKLAFDQEAFDCWKKLVPEDRILRGNKKDNFWEMGDTGPCGPCTEIHIDLRDDAERKKIDGKTLVNNDHPQVVEIWNNVFMEFERKADGSLVKLPKQHVDTGMGFERLCMALQGKKSNYDTDVFQPLIQFLVHESGKKYGIDESTDIALRVIADHIRTIAFAIADGQLPSNNKAGYVIRRILRRAVRYGYTFLSFQEPFMYSMVEVLVAQMGATFPEIVVQQSLIERVIKEEEASFLKTLGNGITRFENYCKSSSSALIDGNFAFELFDTYGFPIDLTQLLAREKKRSVEMDEFNQCMQQQKQRSRAAAAVDTEDWVYVSSPSAPQIQLPEEVFVGYEFSEIQTELLQYRKVKAKGKEQFQFVLSKTPFYAESGGQVGDTGILEIDGESIEITDTKKENGIIIHFGSKLPLHPEGDVLAKINVSKRNLTENNHSATHLMHAALRQILGTHVEQKGSLVNADYLRFDFSHFAKVTAEEIAAIEQLVNQKIRENITQRTQILPISEAKKLGAMALFGEKYGDYVRVVTFDPIYSVELCGGTHVAATGQIGLFKIIAESAVAAGVRRIEAITALKAETFFTDQSNLLQEVKTLLNNPKDVVKSVHQLLDENTELTKKIESMLREKASLIKADLQANIKLVNGIHFIAEKIELNSAEAIKDLAFELQKTIPNIVACIGANVGGKATLTLIISENLVKEKGLNASTIIREIAKEIKGGGGGQAHFATAGGTDSSGIENALAKISQLIS